MRWLVTLDSSLRFSVAEDVPVLALDGPGGSGKGTIARRVAETLGWHLLDSGALYRLVALAALEAEIDLNDVDGLSEAALKLDVRFENKAGDERVWLRDREVSDVLRSEETGAVASRIAPQPAIRAALLKVQRGFRQSPGLVADGRDMGTVVFTDAVVKVFLTASLEERVRRRYNQLKEKGIDVSLAAVSKDMATRDRRDTKRSVAPLKAATDARILDSTHLSPEQVTHQLLDWLKQAGISPKH
jgi:cytidylate kinase